LGHSRSLLILFLILFSVNSYSQFVPFGFWKKLSLFISQQAYVKAVNSGAGDLFGQAVSISHDTLVVGVPSEDSNLTTITNGPTASANNSAATSGAVYVYRRSGSIWVQEAYIKASNAASLDSFGQSVAISGDTLVVGAPFEDSNQTTITNGTTASSDNSASSSGAVYVYQRTGITWAQQAYIKAANADANDSFGNSVVIDGETIVVSSTNESSAQTNITNGTAASADNSANSAGAVYVYQRSGGIWNQEAYIKAANSEAFDQFGKSIAISGDTLVVGSTNESSAQTTITNGTAVSFDNSALSTGAVYVYFRTSTIWVQQAYIKPPVLSSGDTFGHSVSISGNTVVVGAPNEDSNQTFITSGFFASADNSANNAGAVYVYQRTGVSWAQEAYIKAANSGPGDLFGWSLAISGDIIAVGAYEEDSNQIGVLNGMTASFDNSLATSGAAYVYKRSGGIWNQIAFIKASNPDSNDNFGMSMSLSGNTLAVGARNEASNATTINGDQFNNSSTQTGAVYVFTAY